MLICVTVFILYSYFKEGWIWYSSVSIVTTIWAGHQWNSGSLPGVVNNFTPSQTIQPSTKWVPGPFPSG